MNITGVSPSSDLSQRYEEFNALQGALQSGNISNAQHAFAAFQQEVQKTIQVTGTGGLFAPGTQPSKDLQQLSSALNAADLAGAQTAFASLKQDIQTAGGGSSALSHHHPSKTLVQGGRIATSAQASTAVVGGILNSQA